MVILEVKMIMKNFWLLKIIWLYNYIFLLFKFRMQRRSAGKRLRIDQEQEQQYYGQASNASEGSFSNQDAEEEEEAFDPIAFYQQQRSEMLIDSAQHVQASQIEIQQAQLDAQQRDQMHQEPSHEGGGRRSRRAAAAASAALSMMDMEEMGRTPARESSPTPSPARATRPRGARGGFSSARGGRGRPRGSTAAVMSRRKIERGDPSPEDGGPIRRGRPRKTVTDITPEDESSLYFIIRNGKASLQQVKIKTLYNLQIKSCHDFCSLSFW